jgi:hypothetical protein
MAACLPVPAGRGLTLDPVPGLTAG